MHINFEVGKIICEMIEDIQVIYKSVEKELSKIMTTQKDIERLIQP